MTYQISSRLFIENGPTIQAARSAAARRSSHAFLAWRSLDENRRLELVDKALAGAADDRLSDGSPAAL